MVQCLEITESGNLELHAITDESRPHQDYAIRTLLGAESDSDHRLRQYVMIDEHLSLAMWVMSDQQTYDRPRSDGRGLSTNQAATWIARMFVSHFPVNMQIRGPAILSSVLTDADQRIGQMDAEQMAHMVRVARVVRTVELLSDPFALIDQGENS